MALLTNFNRNDFTNSAVEKFVEDKFAGVSITEIKNTIAQTEIKMHYHQHLERYRNLI